MSSIGSASSIGLRASPVTIAFDEIKSSNSSGVAFDTQQHLDLTEDLKNKVLFLTHGAIHVDEARDSQRLEGTTQEARDLMSDATDQSSEGKLYPSFDVGPFEGVEKRLIVEFFPESLLASPALVNGSLRSLTSDQWQSVLDKACCRILSSKELVTPSGGCTAYLLSESSLFVYDRRVILKTCGTTTPLLAFPALINLVTRRRACHSNPELEAVNQTVTATKNTHRFDAFSLASYSTAPSISSSSSPPLHFQPSFLPVPSTLSLSSLASPRATNNNSSDTHSLSSPSTPLSRSDLHASSGTLSVSVDEPSAGDTTMGAFTFSPGNSDAGSDTAGLPSCRSELDLVGDESDDEASRWDEASRVTAWVLFSHLTYCFPTKQRFPHRSNDEEVEYLDRFFQRNKEESQAVGQSRDVFSLRTSIDREFFVYAYSNPMGGPGTVLNGPGPCSVGSESRPFIINELMMLGINEWCVDDFAGKGDGYNPDLSTASTSIVHEIIKPVNRETDESQACDVGTLDSHWNSVLDQFWFKPCGYSCNALMEDASASQSGPCFATAHISPELQSSYASLEVSFPFDLERLNSRGEMPRNQTQRDNSNYPAAIGTTGKPLASDASPRHAFQLCPVKALTTFNPKTVHVVEVALQLGGQTPHSDHWLGGLTLNSGDDDYRLLAAPQEYKGGWFHIRHAEYLRV